VAAGAAVGLLGLPSLAGATSQHSFGFSRGGHAFAPSEHLDRFADLDGKGDDRKSDFFEALHDGRDDIPELARFAHGRFHGGRHDDDSPFGGLFRHDRFRLKAHSILSALFFRFPHKHDRPPEVPEPGTGLLLAGALIAVSVGRRRRRR